MAKTNHIIGEVWRVIPGFSGYEISNRGRVRSFLKRGRFVDTPWILKPCIGTSGYLHVGIFDNNHIKRICRVHRLVLLAFVGPCPPGHETCHWDGTRNNNWVENLYWGTHQHNMSGRRIPCGYKRQSRKTLSPKDVKRAVNMRRRGTGYREIAEVFGLSPGWISKILRQNGCPTCAQRKRAT